MSFIPVQSEAVDISSTDHTFVNRVDAIDVGGQYGTLVGRLRGDTADSTWNLNGRYYLFGDFVKVTKTGTTATLTGLVGVRGGDTERRSGMAT